MSRVIKCNLVNVAISKTGNYFVFCKIYIYLYLLGE